MKSHHLVNYINTCIAVSGCPVTIMEHQFIKNSSILWATCWMFTHFDFSVLHNVYWT